jgi:hypothetical protein
MLGLNIKANGLLSALPYLIRYLGGLIHRKIADILYGNKERDSHKNMCYIVNLDLI